MKTHIKPDKINLIALEIAKILPEQWEDSKKTLCISIPIIQESDVTLISEQIYIELNKKQFEFIKNCDELKGNHTR